MGWFARAFAKWSISLVVLAFLLGAVPTTMEDAMKAYQAGNCRKAADLWRLKAKLGNLEARYRLGTMLANGDCLPGLEDQGIHLLKSAALDGFAPAQAELGMRYMLGEGVPIDPNLGLSWLAQARGRGGFSQMAGMVPVNGTLPGTGGAAGTTGASTGTGAGAAAGAGDGGSAVDGGTSSGLGSWFGGWGSGSSGGGGSSEGTAFGTGESSGSGSGAGGGSGSGGAWGGGWGSGGSGLGTSADTGNSGVGRGSGSGPGFGGSQTPCGTN